MYAVYISHQLRLIQACSENTALYVWPDIHFLSMVVASQIPTFGYVRTLIMCSWTQVHSWLPRMESSSSSEMKKNRGKAFLLESK